VLTPHAFRHLGMPEPKRDTVQFGLFQNGNEDEA
jgi:Holliday junction DNA helicase RuvB